MGRKKLNKQCSNCGCVKDNILYYRDPTGKGDHLCRNCWVSWTKHGDFSARRTRAVGKCDKCGKRLYRETKWGLICTGCRRGDGFIVSNNGSSIKNPSLMLYDERETCRRLVVKWKRGMLNAADIYSMVNIYIDYHFKNEEMDTLKMDKQIEKMMTWMVKLFEKDLVDPK